VNWRYGSEAKRVERRTALDAALAGYESPLGMLVYDRGKMAGGSRGGCPIWVMQEAYMPKDEHLAARERGAWGRQQWEDNPKADPDGFAVFGRFPKGWLNHILQQSLLGRVRREEILHVCSGTLSESETWTVDIRPQARPLVIANGCHLPFRDASFKAVLLDPPYSDQYARNLYGVENPRPAWLLREAARVIQRCGRIGILHIAVPFAPPECRLMKVYGVSTGPGFRIRAFSVYEKEQSRLL